MNLIRLVGGPLRFAGPAAQDFAKLFRRAHGTLPVWSRNPAAQMWNRGRVARRPSIPPPRAKLLFENPIVLCLQRQGFRADVTKSPRQGLGATGESPRTFPGGPASGRGGRSAALRGPSRNSLATFVFGEPSVLRLRRRAESAERTGVPCPGGVGELDGSLGMRPAPAAAICPPVRPRQSAARNQSVRVRSAASCSGTEVCVAQIPTVDGSPHAPRRKCGRLKSPWSTSERRIFDSSWGSPARWSGPVPQRQRRAAKLQPSISVPMFTRSVVTPGDWLGQFS
jgi:hypothetical protein